MKWILFILGCSALVYASPASIRQALLPHLVYDFLDADASQDFSNTVTATDKAGGSSAISPGFGSLTLNMSRCSWLLGRPGVHLANYSGSTPYSAMISANTWNNAWKPRFSSFTVEMWFSGVNNPENGDFWEIGGEAPLHGTGVPTLGPLYPPEPFLVFTNLGNPQQWQFSAASDDITGSDITSYSRNVNALTTYALFMQYSPPGNYVCSIWANGTSQLRRTSTTSSNLNFSDPNARLRFLHQGLGLVLDYDLHFFAMYGTALGDANFSTLANAGLPNVRPVARPFSRAVEETTGGSITFCRNDVANPLDSDCLDYDGPGLSLSPPNRLTVFIQALPAKGSLYDGATKILAAPYRLATTTVMFVPNPDENSWVANQTGGNYFWNKLDYTSFDYLVQDLQGLNSTVATVTVEVFPKHNPPVAASLIIHDPPSPSVYAGRQFRNGSLANSILLAPQWKEFFKPRFNETSCANYLSPGAGGTYLNNMCPGNGQPPDASSYATIRSLPSVGQLWQKAGGQFVPITTTPTQVNVDTYSNPVPCGGSGSPCQDSWILYYNVSLATFNGSTAQDLVTVNFTYDFTTSWGATVLNMGTTHYGIDSNPNPTAPAVPGYSLTQTSTLATVTLTVKNGFYATSGLSTVKQRHVDVGGQVQPQLITLDVADLTVPNPVITVWITSLPDRGALYLLGNGTALLDCTSVNPCPMNNLSLQYAPSLPGDPNGYLFANPYTNFSFFAVSNTVRSATALQKIGVTNTNDAVLIQFSSNTAFQRAGNPQTWTDLEGGGNDFYINWTDPDPYTPGEPYYRVTLSSSLFQIFISDASFLALKPGISKPGNEQLGILTGGTDIGAGALDWTFVANRSTAYAALNPIRLRPNNVGDGSFAVTIIDCQFLQGVTDPSFNTQDWQPLTNQKSVQLTGTLSDGKPPIVGVADPVILGVIYGVSAFVGLVFLIAIFCLVRYCMNKANGGASRSAAGGASSSGGSKRSGSKAKKTKSAYLHTVEL